MSFWNRTFALRFTKRVLIFLFFLLLAAIIWYLGPTFGYGEIRPLEDSTSRITYIVLLAVIFVGLWCRVPCFLLGVLTVCVTFWVFSPYLLLGESYPFEETTPRLIVIGVITLATLLYCVWLLISMLRFNPEKLDRFFKSRRSDSVRVERYREVVAIINNAARYVAYTGRKISRWSYFWRPKKVVYDLPWYMMLGPKDAGKTTAILSSGQEFPLPEQLLRVSKESTPTTNCECWFTNEAIFVDTSGKYINELDENSGEWDALVKAIKKNRPLKSLNGVVVTIPVTDLMGKDKKELYALSSKFRTQLDFLRHELGVRFPVYVLITKMDMVSGFDEYFRSLTLEERDQIWGFTLPFGEKKKKSDAVVEIRDVLRNELSGLESRLDKDMTARMLDEYDVTTRKRMYQLPQDFRLLADAITEFGQNVFSPSRYDDTQKYTSLRGIYFASSTQSTMQSLLNPHTIVQKWRDMANSLEGKDVIADKAEDTEDRLVQETVNGKHFFLKQLFDNFIRDRNLVRYNLALTAKYRFQTLAGHLLCIVLTIWLCYALVNSYHNNRVYLDEATDKVEQVSTVVDEYLETNSDGLLAKMLSLTQDIPVLGVFDFKDPRLSYRYGLYVGFDIQEESNKIYQYFLQRWLLFSLERMTEKSLFDAVTTDNQDIIYDKLKTYLILHGEGKFDKDYLIKSLTEEAQTTHMIENYGQTIVFVSHLEELFNDPNWNQYNSEINDRLVAAARVVLQKKPLASRLYQKVKEQAMTEAPENITLYKLSGDQLGSILEVSDETLAVNGIPGIFTNAGYHQVFKKKLTEYVKTIQSEDSWITGQKNEGRKVEIKQLDGFYMTETEEAVLKLYLQEYVATWNQFLNGIQLKKLVPDGAVGNDTTFDMYALQILSSPDSPLIDMMTQIAHETAVSVDFAKQESEIPDLSQTQAGRNLTTGRMGSVARNLKDIKTVKDALSQREKKILYDNVDRRFGALHRLVNLDTSPKPGSRVMQAGQGSDNGLVKIINMLGDQHNYLVIKESTMEDGSALPFPSEAEKRLKAESRLWPAPLKAIIMPLLGGISTKLSQQFTAQSNEAVKLELGDMCVASFQGSYPFANSEEEVSLEEFEVFFGPNGIVDAYFKENMVKLVDTTTSPWRYKREDLRGNEDKEVLRFFEQAQEIKKAFFRNGMSENISFSFTASIPALSPRILQFGMNVNGTNLTYKHGPVWPKSFKWPEADSENTITMNAVSADNAESSDERVLMGEWSLLRWMDMASEQKMTSAAKQVIVYKFGDQKVSVNINGLNYKGKPINTILKKFKCPTSI
ncbi:MAG: type VI secretion system membrane subunit TssM [Morganella sp. (in: enterobacteria)]